ncbi:MAG: hypothetical protein WAN14_16495 [Candidatus Acidiferrales bacterium]
MKACTCGRQLDNSAKACPGCGKTFRVTSGFTKFVGWSFLVVLVLAVIGAMSAPTPSTPVVSAAQQAANQKDEAAFQRAVAGAKQLKQSMRSPDSFVLGETLIMDNGAVCYDYRSQNGFGGMNAGQAVLSPSGQFKSDESTGFTSLWNKQCGGKTGSDKTWEVGLAAGFHGMFDKQ